MVIVMEDDMPLDELSKKAFKCLVDNFGYCNAMNYVQSLMEEGRNMPPNYSELEMKKFDDIDQEQFVKDAIEYAKNHNLD